MKTFDIVAMVFFTIYAIFGIVASFNNAAHIVTVIISVILAIIAWLDYKKEKKDEN